MNINCDIMGVEIAFWEESTNDSHFYELISVEYRSYAGL